MDDVITTRVHEVLKSGAIKVFIGPDKKIISTISLSLIVLFSFGGLVNAETTMSAEGQIRVIQVTYLLSIQEWVLHRHRRTSRFRV